MWSLGSLFPHSPGNGLLCGIKLQSHQMDANKSSISRGSAFNFICLTPWCCRTVDLTTRGFQRLWLEVCVGGGPSFCIGKVDSEQKKKENPQNSFSSCPAGSTSSSVDFHLMQRSARPNNRAKREGKGKIAGDSVCSLTPTLRRMRTSVTRSVFPPFFSFSQQKNQGLTRFIFGLTWRDHLLLRTPKHKLADPLVAPLRKRITERRWVLTESPPPSSCAVQDVWGNIWSPPPRG